MLSCVSVLLSLMTSIWPLEIKLRSSSGSSSTGGSWSELSKLRLLTSDRSGNDRLVWLDARTWSLEMLGLESEILVETRDTDIIGRGLTGMSSEETAATGWYEFIHIILDFVTNSPIWLTYNWCLGIKACKIRRISVCKQNQNKNTCYSLFIIPKNSMVEVAGLNQTRQE